MAEPKAPKTLAEAARERRDLVTGEVMDEARLIRFVVGPEGTVVPDLARKLPGRGLWVEASRASVETAAKKNLFSRSAKMKLTAPTGLADEVERLLVARLLSGLGLARRAGDLTFGFEKVQAVVASGKAAWMIEASDGQPDGRRKILAAGRRAPNTPGLFGVFTSDEMGLALGLDNVIHLAFLAGPGAKPWGRDAVRLSAFRPLYPADWLADGQVG